MGEVALPEPPQPAQQRHQLLQPGRQVVSFKAVPGRDLLGSARAKTEDKTASSQFVQITSLGDGEQGCSRERVHDGAAEPDAGGRSCHGGQ